MRSGCESKEIPAKRSIELPVLPNTGSPNGGMKHSKTRIWRAVSLSVLTLLMIVHYIQWSIMGTTISPIEPSEAAFTLQNGYVNAGFIFFTLAILATLIFGRFVCGWGCHIVALQDFCAWLLNKFGLKPRPFRSRLLVFVPLIAALYMFAWPTAAKFLYGPKNQPLIPEFTNHLITTEFWATFPPFWIAVPFLFICGFMTVYFLGSKGFCTYGCPYGGIFVLADKVAPVRIRVNDNCNECGHCTAACTSNVNVAAEVKKYGMVIDPGCMKHMDCISVCPNDALYLGVGQPAVAGGRNPSGSEGGSSTKKNHQLTWPEEIFAAIVFAASYFAIWNVYQIVPMLMALGIAAVTTYLAVRSLKIFTSKDLTFYRSSLRSAGTIKLAGWAFLGFSTLWIGINAHSGWIRYHEREGTRGYESVNIPDELALAQANPKQWLSADDEKNIAYGKRYFYKAFDNGFLVNDTLLPKLAWLEYLSGNTDQGIKLLALAAKHQEGRPKALSLYYRGAILNRLGRYNDALTNLDEAIATAPELVTALEERGVSLWQLGKRQEAVKTWTDAVESNKGIVLANYMLAGAAEIVGDADAKAAYEKQAEQHTPKDPFFHWMVALRLQNVGMTSIAEKHFQIATQLDPKFRDLRN
ncbi:MAG: tetratricopeptide repeat protein [Chloracidobacterium sp.]|nr:tetratricopeptide repeat protein [Chloracidobacterium sp.]